MDGKRLIQKLSFRNILSFGDKVEEIELQPLNVLIGQNGSGKSNFIEILNLLRNTTGNRFSATIVNGGGIAEYLWKGTLQIPIAEIQGIFLDNPSVLYKLAFTKIGQQVEIVDEEILSTKVSHDQAFYYRNKNGNIEIANWSNTVNWGDFNWGTITHLDRARFNQQSPVFSQIRDPSSYPIISELASKFEDIRIFKDLVFDPIRSPRLPINTSTFGEFLSSDGTNLAIVLNDLHSKYFDAYKELVEKLTQVYGRIERLITHIQNGTVQLYVQEKGLESQVSATRLSDGTLRYLCLLTILCHPEPPPLICLEEPEAGLHPDMLPTIAELLIEASTRTQLVVTTHSDILVSALSHVPEAVLVCERDEEGTHFKRLEGDKLKLWLEEYSLGEIWLKGEIGGTRW
jgi:predicted ATPase